MPRNAGTSESRFQIRADRLLLVEGRDEVNLFKALIERRGDAEPAIQVIDAGGKDRFPRRLRAIRTAAQTRSTLRSIGVVRDADDDAGSAFGSVCDHLRNVGYEPPAAHGEFSEAMPSIGVFIVPDGSEPGAIETLCRLSVEGTVAAGCVDEYIECLQRHDAMQSRNADKSFATCLSRSHERPLGKDRRRGVERHLGLRVSRVRGALHLPSRPRRARHVNGHARSQCREAPGAGRENCGPGPTPP